MMYVPSSDDEAEFLASYDPSKYPITVVTVDTVITRGGKHSETELVLIKRKGYPFKGRWALPGGHLDEGETTQQAAEREVVEETGLTLTDVRFMMVADTPDRDPRGRVVGVVYSARADGEPYAGDDAAEAKWFTFRDALQMDLAFDHHEIVRRAWLED